MGNILIGAGALTLALTLALLLSLHRKLDALPARVWSIAKQERARDESQALTALREATAAKVGSITGALRLYEEEVAERARAQVAEAEKRARIAERRASNTASALEAAAHLVRELRAALDDLRAQRAPQLEPADATQGAAPQSPAAESDERQTIEMPGLLPTIMPPPRPVEEEDSDELTTIATRPLTDLEIAS